MAKAKGVDLREGQAQNLVSGKTNKNTVEYFAQYCKIIWYGM